MLPIQGAQRINQISNMWWVIEYGLLETERGTKLYEASARCLTSAYERRNLANDAFFRSYDATSQQSALHMSDSFLTAKQLLHELAADVVAARVA